MLSVVLLSSIFFLLLGILIGSSRKEAKDGIITLHIEAPTSGQDTEKTESPPQGEATAGTSEPIAPARGATNALSQMTASYLRRMHHILRQLSLQPCNGREAKLLWSLRQEGLRGLLSPEQYRFLLTLCYVEDFPLVRIEEETRPKILKALRLRQGEVAKVWLPLDPDDEVPRPSFDGTSAATHTSRSYFLALHS